MNNQDPKLVLVWESPNGTRFAQMRAASVRWVEEYPDATEFATFRAASTAKKVCLKHDTKVIVIVENYGYEDEVRM